jgi:hypothetical protein
MFAFVGIYSLLLARDTADAKTRAKYVLLGAILCAGAALTKQAGLFIAAMYPLLTWLLVYRGREPDRPWDRRLIWLALPAALLIGLIAPWYVYKLITIHRGTEPSLTTYLLFDIHAGRNFAQRLAHAAGLLIESLSLPGAVALLLAMAFALGDRVQRWLMALVTLPFVLIWAVGFSYETRNAALAIPFAGMAAGMGVVQIIALAGRGIGVRARAADDAAADGATCWSSKILLLKVGCVLALAAVLLVVLGVFLGRDRLIARHRRLQRTVGMPEVNEQLYAYDARQKIDGQIASDYLALPWVPGLAQRGVSCTADTLKSFRRVYDRPDVKYALIYKGRTCPEVQQYLQAAGGAGDSEVLFDLKIYRFYRKKEGR